MSQSNNTPWWWCVGLALVFVVAGGVSILALKERARTQAERKAKEREAEEREAEERAAREAEVLLASKEFRLKLLELAVKRKACEEALALARHELSRVPQPAPRWKLKVIEREAELEQIVAQREALLRGLHVVEDR